MSSQNKKNFRTATKDCRHTVTPVTQISLEHSCNEGLDYILRHFDESQDQIWSRTISTKATQGRQIIVNNKGEALSYFEAANYRDCRISAFPYWRPSILSDVVGIKNAIVPNLIMIDLDMDNFDSDEEELMHGLRETLRKIRELLLGFKPTVIWSGNGYHIYLPINANVVLENVVEFSEIEQVSTKFLRFAEWYLSSGKSDSAHNNTVSLNNCMLRIPGTYNSKNNTQVKIIKRWNGKRHDISLLIGSFCAYLLDQRIKHERLDSAQTQKASVIGDYSIVWIEKLFQTPIQDYRKYCIWRIFGPYLLNVRGLSYEQAFSIIGEWLDRCSKQRRLDFNSKSKINESLKGAAKKGYLPIGIEKLKMEMNTFYNLLQDEGVI